MQSAQPTWFGQPRGLTILFLTEMWEKFSFFGMKAMLVYYMVKHLHFAQGDASLIYGTYSAILFLTPIAGAYVSDRWLGRRRAIIIGSVTMAVGHFFMAFEPLLYLAMGTIALGNGFFLPNLPSQVGALYEKDDPRRQSAYSIYYLGVNVGAFLAPLGCGTIGEIFGWHYGFAVAGIGMCVGLAIYLFGTRYLPPDTRSTDAPAVDAAQRDPAPIGLLIAVLASVIVFRAAYEQSGNAVALWIDSGVDRTLGGWTIPATWFQSLDPLFVFTITPLLVAYWNRKKLPHSYRMTALRRMSLGALGVALSYLLLCGVISMAGGGTVHWILAVLFFLLYTVGELYILPVGLALFATTSSARFAATGIAAWFLGNFAGNLLAGYVGTWWSKMTPLAFFGAMAAIAGAASVALVALAASQRSGNLHPASTRAQ